MKGKKEKGDDQSGFLFPLIPHGRGGYFYLRAIFVGCCIIGCSDQGEAYQENMDEEVIKEKENREAHKKVFFALFRRKSKHFSSLLAKTNRAPKKSLS